MTTSAGLDRDFRCAGSPRRAWREGLPELHQAHADVGYRVDCYSFPAFLDMASAPTWTGSVVCLASWIWVFAKDNGVSLSWRWGQREDREEIDPFRARMRHHVVKRKREMDVHACSHKTKSV